METNNVSRGAQSRARFFGRTSPRIGERRGGFRNQPTAKYLARISAISAAAERLEHRITPAAWAVYQALQLCATDGHAECAQSVIREITGYSYDTIRRAVQQLERAGLLFRPFVPGYDDLVRRRTTRYLLAHVGYAKRDFGLGPRAPTPEQWAGMERARNEILKAEARERADEAQKETLAATLQWPQPTTREESQTERASRLERASTWTQALFTAASVGATKNREVRRVARGVFSRRVQPAKSAPLWSGGLSSESPSGLKNLAVDLPPPPPEARPLEPAATSGTCKRLFERRTPE